MEGNKNNKVVQPLQNNPEPKPEDAKEKEQPSPQQQNEPAKQEEDSPRQAPVTGQTTFGPNVGKTSPGDEAKTEPEPKEAALDGASVAASVNAHQASSSSQSGQDQSNSQTPSFNFSGGNPQTPASTSSQMSSPTAPGASMAAPATNDFKHKTYLIEFLLYLIITGILLGLAVSFFTGIVNSIGSESQSFWGAESVYNNSLMQISSALVLALFAWVLSGRCYKTESSSPAVKQHKWRKAFLAIFIVLVSLSALGATVAFVGGIAMLIGGIGLEGSDSTDAVQGLSIGLFSALLLWGAALLYGNDYLNKRVAGGLSIVRRYGLLALVVVLALAYILFPLQDERAAITDDSQDPGLFEPFEDSGSNWEDDWNDDWEDDWDDDWDSFEQDDDDEWMDELEEDMWQ